MPDNTKDRDVVLNAGTGGAHIATEFSKLGGLTAHFQLIKPVHGASGTINFVGDDSPWPSILRGGASNNLLTTTLLSGSNDTLDVNVRGQSGAAYLAVNLEKFAGFSLSSTHGIPITNLGRTGDQYLTVAGFNGAPIAVTGGTGGVSIRLLNGGTIGHTGDNTSQLDFVVVQGVTGAYPVGITTDVPLLIKFPSGEGLSAGAPGAVQGAPHSVAVQGMSGAFPIGITAGNTLANGLFIRGITHSTDSIVVHGYEGAVSVGVTANAGGFNIRGLTGTRDVVGIIGWGPGGTAAPGTTLDIRNLVSARDVVGITGTGMSGSINTRIIGGTGNAVGVSGDALRVSIADATIAATVNVGSEIEVSNDAGNGLYVQGTTTGNPLTITAATGATFTVIATDLDIRAISDTTDSIRVVGTTGSYDLGITAGHQISGNPGLNIRRLYGGTFGYSGDQGTTGYTRIDTVAIQGMCGGYHVTVGATAGGLGIRTITSATDSIRVVGSTGSYDVGVTAGNQHMGEVGFNVRRLFGGTAGSSGGLSGGINNGGIDSVAVQGLCGGWPVGISASDALPVISSSDNPVIVKGASGPFGALPVQLFSAGGTAFGMSSDGESLRVSIADANINATVTVSSQVEISNDDGNPIPISGGNTAAVNIQGIGGSAGHAGHVWPVVVAGTTGHDGIPLRVAGVTGGTPIRIATDSNNPVNITNISGTVSLPTGAVADATLSELSNTIGATLSGLGLTLDRLFSRLPGGRPWGSQEDLDGHFDFNDPTKTLPSYALIEEALPIGNSNNKRLPDSAKQNAIKNAVETVASTISDSAMKVSMDVGAVKNPTSFSTGQFAVTASGQQITGSSVELKSGVNIKGHPRNEDHIFIREDSTANNGYPLGAGEELYLDVDNLNKVFVYADQTGLTLCYFAR